MQIGFPLETEFVKKYYEKLKKSYKASSCKFFCTANESSSGEVLDQQSVLLLWKYSEAFLPVNHCHYPSLMAINFGTNYYTRTDTLAISQLTSRPGVWVGNLIEHFTNMPLVNKLSGHMIHSASSLMFISNQCYLWVQISKQTILRPAGWCLSKL